MLEYTIFFGNIQCHLNLSLKVNGYSFMGNNKVIYNSASFSKGSQRLKERICSHRSKFFPLTVDSHFAILGVFVIQKSKQDVTKDVLPVEMVESL